MSRIVPEKISPISNAGENTWRKEPLTRSSACPTSTPTFAIRIINNSGSENKRSKRRSMRRRIMCCSSSCSVIRCSMKTRISCAPTQNTAPRSTSVTAIAPNSVAPSSCPVELAPPRLLLLCALPLDVGNDPSGFRDSEDKRTVQNMPIVEGLRTINHTIHRWLQARLERNIHLFCITSSDMGIPLINMRTGIVQHLRCQIRGIDNISGGNVLSRSSLNHIRMVVGSDCSTAPFAGSEFNKIACALASAGKIRESVNPPNTKSTGHKNICHLRRDRFP